MNKYLKMSLYGALIWVVPYIVSIVLFPTGIMQNDVTFFKSIMIVVGTITGLIASIYYIRSEKSFTVKDAWVTGIFWLVLNWILDFVGLLPMSGQSIDRYFMEIGIRYIAMVTLPLVVAYTKKK